VGSRGHEHPKMERRDISPQKTSVRPGGKKGGWPVGKRRVKDWKRRTMWVKTQTKTIGDNSAPSARTHAERWFKLVQCSFVKRVRVEAKRGAQAHARKRVAVNLSGCTD